MKQTGFLYKINPTDFITGASPLVSAVVNESANWKLWLPITEKQYKQATFDTMSCATFSALSIIETWIKWHIEKGNFSQKQLETMKGLGYFASGEFNASDRFTAIMSGTMPNGNYFQSVIDSIRKDGLLPEVLFPFGGNSWNEYHDKTKITETMKVTAKKILDILDISYEWTQVEKMSFGLKECPIQGAIPAQASHAVEIISTTEFFDTYEPYIKPLPIVQYAMKIIVNVKKDTPKYKYFKDSEVTGLKPELVEKLDAIRSTVGFPMSITSGLRTKAQNDALKDSASNSSHITGYAVDIACKTSSERFKLIIAAHQYGITRIGINFIKKFVHLDIDNTKPQGVVWGYE